MSDDEIETWLNQHLAHFLDFEPRCQAILWIMANFKLTPKHDKMPTVMDLYKALGAGS